jgi:cell division protein FtsW (lipid II flippase)
MRNFFTGRLVLVRFILLLSTVALLLTGIVSIYSLGHPAEPGPSSHYDDLSSLWKKQVVLVAVGIAGFIIVNLFNYRRLGPYSYWLYAFVLVLLILLLVDRYLLNIPDIFIEEIRQTHRWLKIPYIGQSFQPSELCKLSYVLVLAWYLRYRSNYRSFSALIGPFALAVLPMVLILFEPNLGTVLLMMPVLFSMLFVAGAKVRHLLLIVLLAIIVSPVLWFGMNPYQRIRISSVLLQSEGVRTLAENNPKMANILVGSSFSTRQWESNWGYHLIRSKYAVASGGMTGYGFRKGPFIKYDFLPERQNDFIFAAIAEQWGFLGCVILLFVYIIFISCGMEIASDNTDPFGRFLAVGIVSMFIVEVVVNVGMTVGLMPITGLTLPFVSYGGSSLLVNMTAVGLLNNIGQRRQFSVAPRLPR